VLRVRPADGESAGANPAQCGYTGSLSAVLKVDTKSRDPIPGLPGSLPKLENATRDLFRLSGGQSIPVEPRLSAETSVPPAGSKGTSKAPSVPAEPSSSSASGRKQEASIIFSLEALMKSAAPAPDKSPKDDEIDQQLWDMHAVTPIFGTAQDQALLTTPLEPAPRSSSVDSMTVSSHQPGGRRWPLLLALGAGAAVALGGFGFWSLRSSASASASIADRTVGTERVGTGNGVVPAAATPGSPASNGAPVGEALAVTTQPSVAGAPAPGNVTAETAAPATAALAAAGTGSGATPVAVPNAGAGEATPGQAAPAALKTADSAPSTSAEPAPSKQKEPREHAAVSRSTRVKAPAKLEPFDKSAAVSALNAAATKAESCPHTGGGKGKVQLTFGTNGKVSSAEIVEGPFAASTPAGKCALRHFHAAKVPPFSGSAVTVAKSFKLP
jgi:hypothetical protein